MNMELVGFAWTVLLISSLKQVAALTCYECSSIDEMTCGETLALGHSLEPVLCDEHLQQAQYCVKYTGLFEDAKGLSCYQCSSSISRYCSEKFPLIRFGNLNKTTVVDWDPVPTSCDNVFQARYCVKTTGLFEGMIGTKRFCSSRDFGNYCEWVRRPGDEREYRSCVYTCAADACNAAPQYVPHNSVLTALSSGLAVLSLLYSYL